MYVCRYTGVREWSSLVGPKLLDVTNRLRRSVRRTVRRIVRRFRAPKSESDAPNRGAESCAESVRRNYYGWIRIRGAEIDFDVFQSPVWSRGGAEMLWDPQKFRLHPMYRVFACSC